MGSDLKSLIVPNTPQPKGWAGPCGVVSCHGILLRLAADLVCHEIRRCAPPRAAKQLASPSSGEMGGAGDA